MNAKEFEELSTQRVEHCLSLLNTKGMEYSRNGDRLHNFYTAAAMSNNSEFEALWGMWVKHLVSVKDMVLDCANGVFPNQQLIDDKLSDTINYSLLLEGLIVEAKKHSIPSVPPAI